MGAGSALVAFFRSLGGASGVSALGAVLSAKASATIVDRPGARSASTRRWAALRPPYRTWPRSPPRSARPWSTATAPRSARSSSLAAPMGIIAFLAILLLKEVPLGTISGVEAVAAEREEHVLAPEPAREREPAFA